MPNDQVYPLLRPMGPTDDDHFSGSSLQWSSSPAANTIMPSYPPRTLYPPPASTNSINTSIMPYPAPMMTHASQHDFRSMGLFQEAPLSRSTINGPAVAATRATNKPKGRNKRKSKKDHPESGSGTKRSKATADADRLGAYHPLLDNYTNDEALYPDSGSMAGPNEHAQKNFFGEILNLPQGTYYAPTHFDPTLATASSYNQHTQAVSQGQDGVELRSSGLQSGFPEDCPSGPSSAEVAALLHFAGESDIREYRHRRQTRGLQSGNSMSRVIPPSIPDTITSGVDRTPSLAASGTYQEFPSPAIGWNLAQSNTFQTQSNTQHEHQHQVWQSSTGHFNHCNLAFLQSSVLGGNPGHDFDDGNLDPLLRGPMA